MAIIGVGLKRTKFPRIFALKRLKILLVLMQLIKLFEFEPSFVQHLKNKGKTKKRKKDFTPKLCLRRDNNNLIKL